MRNVFMILIALVVMLLSHYQIYKLGVKHGSKKWEDAIIKEAARLLEKHKKDLEERQKIPPMPKAD